jgi:hypothetical protein
VNFRETNARAEYFCHGASLLEGTNSRECGPDGLWTGTTPQCGNLHIEAFIYRVCKLLFEIPLSVSDVSAQAKIESNLNALVDGKLEHCPSFGEGSHTFRFNVSQRIARVTLVAAKEEKGTERIRATWRVLTTFLNFQMP